MPIFMRLSRDGLPVLPGDATAKGHEKWIELASVQMTPRRSVQTDPQKPDAPAVSEIVVTKTRDSSSPKLFLEAVNGEPCKIEIDFVDSSGQQYLSITLQDALISSYQIGGGRGGERPMESFSLNFTKITFDKQGLGHDVSNHAAAMLRGQSSAATAP